MFKRRSKNENNKHIFQFHGLKSDNKSTRVYFQRIFTQFSIYFFIHMYLKRIKLPCTTKISSKKHL